MLALSKHFKIHGQQLVSGLFSFDQLGHSRATRQQSRIRFESTNVRLKILSAVEQHLGGTFSGEQRPFRRDYVGHRMTVWVSEFSEAKESTREGRIESGICEGWRVAIGEVVGYV